MQVSSSKYACFYIYREHIKNYVSTLYSYVVILHQEYNKQILLWASIEREISFMLEKK